MIPAAGRGTMTPAHPAGWPRAVPGPGLALERAALAGAESRSRRGRPRGAQPMQARPPKVVVNDVTVSFESRGQTVTALQRISLEVGPGEFLCVVGPSGSGKSTLLRVLAGLLRQDAGEVRIAADRPGTPLTAMVFQEHALLPWRTVLDNVTFGLENRGVARAAREARAREMLALVGLRPFARHYPHQLSGGMKQRVGIARALANDPEVLTDEPLAALDAQTRTIMQEELLHIWATLGKTVIYVTHSLEEALLLGDRIVLLTARPARVSQVFPVDLGRPRGLEIRASHAYGLLLEKIWSQLREEVVRAMAEERGA
jgi:NitT/TauT family transport system ATP-binding protein